MTGQTGPPGAQAIGIEADCFQIAVRCEIVKKYGEKMRMIVFEVLALAVGLGAEGEILSKLAQCGRGAAAACGDAEWSLSSPGLAPDWKRGDLTDLIEIACTLGEPYRCDRLGSDLILGRSGRPQRAMAIWARVCTAGIAMSCSKGAAALRSGIGIPRDAERSLAWSVRGCMVKDPEACERVTKAALDLNPGATESTKSEVDLNLGEAEWMADACEKGSIVSCLDNAAPSRRATSLDATNQKCEAGSGEACFALLREAYSYPDVRTEALQFGVRGI